MPNVTTAEKNGRLRHIITLQPGDRVSLCRCYASKTFPFCDGTHKALPHNIGPVIVEVPGEEIPHQPEHPPS